MSEDQITAALEVYRAAIDNGYSARAAMDGALRAALQQQAGEPKPVACGLDTNAPPFAENGIGGLMLARGEAYLDQYAMGTEGADHEPDENEREMLADFMQGLMEDEAMFGPVRELLGKLHAAEDKAKQFADVAMTNAAEVNRLLAASYTPPKADPDVARLVEALSAARDALGGEYAGHSSPSRHVSAAHKIIDAALSGEG